MMDGIYIFDELNSAEKKIVENLLRSREYAAAEVIYKEGEAGDSLNIIASGKVSINKTMVEGDQFCISSLKGGEIFGILSFLDGSRHDATIVSEDRTTLLTLDRTDFDSLLHSEPLIAAKILRRLAIQLASIVRSMNSQQKDLMHLMFKKSK